MPKSTDTDVAREPLGLRGGVRVSHLEMTNDPLPGQFRLVSHLKTTGGPFVPAFWLVSGLKMSGGASRPVLLVSHLKTRGDPGPGHSWLVSHLKMERARDSGAPYNPGMSARESLPDALIIGAPKAGTSALHAALARHPQVYASPVKEPKYYMCCDAPPPTYRGPGDSHSQQEWVWRRQDYTALFDGAASGSVRLESTPFYLYLPSARRRIAEELPQAKLIVIVRDPIDRAYSNWIHLWVDGLEPIADFAEAWRAEDSRIAAGWAPFWHYRRLGRYGQQLDDLLEPRGPRSGPGAALLALGLGTRQNVESCVAFPGNRRGSGPRGSTR